MLAALRRVADYTVVVAVAASLYFAMSLTITGPARADLINNGGMEKPGTGSNLFDGWDDYRWEGEGEVTVLDKGAYSGKRAAIIKGSGPGKIAIFQSIKLPPCTYTLSAMVASNDIVPGQWSQAGALYVSFSDGTNSMNPLLKGSSGWRRMTFTFQVPSALETTIYFFNYGSGELFVDDVSLEAQSPCGSEAKPSFELAATESAPLAYSLPPTVEDRVLEGYCKRPDFKSHALCTWPASAPADGAAEVHATAPKVLADFTDINPFEAPSLLGAKSWKSIDVGSGRRAARLSGNGVLYGDNSTGIAANWVGYDWLEIDAENTGSAPQTLTLEIRDDKTKDYWSRLNWEISLPPGRSTAFVPLQSFVGEKSVIKERRRLDLAHLTRLVLTTAEGAADVIVHKLVLQPEKPYENDFAELIKLDLGPVSGPVEHGFTQVTSGSTYSAKRGYGISADAQIGGVEDRRHPDDLMRDWISFNKGGLDFDLPNGKYRVWMMMEDPGYWEYYPSFLGRRVMANGKTVVDETRSEQDFLGRYFHFDNVEDLPGDDIWKTYIGERYIPTTFETEVVDGQLKLRFDSFGDPRATTVSAILIYPEEQAAKGEAFIGELWERLKRDYGREYREVLPVAPNYSATAGNAFDGALSVFQRPISQNVAAREWPRADEMVSQLKLTMAQGERAVLMAGLHANSALSLIGAELKLDGVAFAPLHVRYKFTRVNQDGTAYASLPRVTDPLRVSDAQPLDFPAGRTHSLWFDLDATGVKPGVHKGALKLTMAGGKTQSIPVSVEVAPWELPKADVPFGYLGIAPTYPGTKYLGITQRQVSEMRDSLKIIKDHGFTGITGGLGGPNFDGYKMGRPSIDVRKADLSVSAIKDVFGPSIDVDSYLGLEISGLPSTVSDEVIEEYKKTGKDVVRDVLTSVHEYSQMRGWPPIVQAIGDEPSGDDIARVASLGRTYRDSGTGIKTSVYTSFGKMDDPAAVFAGTVDRLYLNYHTEAAIRGILDRGSECALYNQVGRYRRGAYLFKVKKLGCRGMLRFAWSSVHADPWYDLDGRESDYAAVYTHMDGKLRLSVDFLRLRESVSDYRYLLKVEQLLATAPDGPARQQAQVWLDGVAARMPGGSGTKDMDDAELATMRREADQHIRQLSGPVAAN